MNNKIKSLEELQAILENLKKEGKKIVHCHGCFDIVHIGHIKHFLVAKTQGDVLIVTLTPDKFVSKGPGRPFFNEEMRLQAIAALECVDYVALNQWETAVETLHLLKPDVYVKGKEVLDNGNADSIEVGNQRVSNLKAEEEVVVSLGGRLYLTDEATFSSSRIINQITDYLPSEAKLYLSDFKKEYSSDQIISLIESLKDIRVLIIGDAILDEYHYCINLEKSKEPLVSYKLVKSNLQPGGAFTIANQIANFTPYVSILTSMGRNAHYELLKNKLDSKIDLKIVLQDEFESLIRKTYVEDYKRTKLFEIYTSDEAPLNEKSEEEILTYLNSNINKFDVIIVSDFGHGLITKKIIDFLVSQNKFLAVNSQLNGCNFGFNFITKYPKADFVSINERELRLAFQEKKGEIQIPMKKLNSLLNVKKINITRGRAGDMYYQDGEFYFAPVFNKEPLDTNVAGDIVLSLLTLLVYRNVDPKIIPFLANSIGALAVRIINNQHPVSLVELNKFIKYVLK